MREPRADLPEMGFPPEKSELESWSTATVILEQARSYLLTTVRPEGRPHTMPLWGVWIDDTFYFSTAETSRKGENLAANAGCTVNVSHDGIDLVVEGEAMIVRDSSWLHQIVDVYSQKYDWPLEVKDGGVYQGGEGGSMYAVKAKVVFAFTEVGGFGATRWRF